MLQPVVLAVPFGGLLMLAFFWYVCIAHGKTELSGYVYTFHLAWTCSLLWWAISSNRWLAVGLAWIAYLVARDQTLSNVHFIDERGLVSLQFVARDALFYVNALGPLPIELPYSLYFCIFC